MIGVDHATPSRWLFLVVAPGVFIAVEKSRAIATGTDVKCIPVPPAPECEQARIIGDVEKRLSVLRRTP